VPVPTTNHAPHGPFVIVGASLAGAKAAEELRLQGFDGPLILVGEEAERPYERPPLTKGACVASPSATTPVGTPEGFYAEHDIDLLLVSASSRSMCTGPA